jgi:gluconolactonase
VSARAAALAAVLAAVPVPSSAGPVPGGTPAASIDLATEEGLRLVQGTWRYSDARLVEATFREPGQDGKPTGPATRTLEVSPRAGAADFDDSGFEAVGAGGLARRRGAGKVSFAWYRLRTTVPERVGAFDTAGSTVVFEVTVDDYAEVWVDGRLAKELGQSGGSVVAGFNVPNRVVVARGARPGQQIQLAVFAMNGPVSEGPPNYIWVRGARLDFHPAPPAPLGVERKDAALDALVPAGATVEKVAGGFLFTEGPVWLPEGALLFSDPNANRIYRWSPDSGVAVFRERSGYDGPDLAEYGQPGSNGLALDPHGRLTVNEHGRRRVVREDGGGRATVLADKDAGRRLNSPNDLVYRSDGTLFFTDPPFGLPRFHDDPRRELPHSGVYRVDPERPGRPVLLDATLRGPNGIALSPDERFLYVGNWDEGAKVILRFALAPDGSVSDRRVFFDLTGTGGDLAIDGVKTDRLGNLYVSAPGGIWVISPEGRHLGTLVFPEQPANFAWGDADRRTLYVTARTSVYRIRLSVGG